MQPKQTTYLTFLDSITMADVPQLQENAHSIIEHFHPKEQSLPTFKPAVFLLDYSIKTYVYVEESFFNDLGYTAQWFSESGLVGFLDKWHRKDFAIINTKIFPYNISFLKGLPSEHYNQYIFSYNYRVSNPKGDYITVLQRFSYVPGTLPGYPAGIIGVAFNITHFKGDPSIIHTIEKATQSSTGVVNELVYKETHPVYEEETGVLLSKRELEIIKLIAEGLSSKQIAAKTRLSINTVNNHRKNMLAKTNMGSTYELIHFAMKQGLI